MKVELRTVQYVASRYTTYTNPAPGLFTYLFMTDSTILWINAWARERRIMKTLRKMLGGVLFQFYISRVDWRK